MTLFEAWFAQARACPTIVDATAMTLATATREGRPSARIVLLKDHAAGFVFYTNCTSRKAGELIDNPYAALTFHWAPLQQQVRIEGPITPVSAGEADAYFASRDRLRQAGAWASLQSQPVPDRHTLEQRVQAVLIQYEGQDIPRPPHWSGYRLHPETMEFWHQREGRLHERDYFRREGEGWRHSLLYP